LKRYIVKTLHVNRYIVESERLARTHAKYPALTGINDVTFQRFNDVTI